MVNPFHETQSTTFLTAKFVPRGDLGDNLGDNTPFRWELDWVIAEFWDNGDIRLIFANGKAVLP
jgi:hypothetical protein